MGDLPDDSAASKPSAPTAAVEANPHYGIADRIAIALFPFLGGSAAADKEAGE